MKFLKMKKILAVVISLLLILPVVPVMVVSATDTVYIDNSTDNAGSAINTYLSLLHQDVVITSGTNIESDEDIIIPADRTLTIEKDVTFDSGMGIDIWADGMLVIEKDAVLTIDNYINVGGDLWNQGVINNVSGASIIDNGGGIQNDGIIYDMGGELPHASEGLVENTDGGQVIPMAPSNLQNNDGTLTWTKSSSYDIAGYEIYIDGSKVSQVTSTTYALELSAPGTYKADVFTLNSYGCKSKTSATINITVETPEPPATATLQSIAVVDGTDGWTPVTVPSINQILYANATLSDGTEIGVYPTNDNITYKWYYAESPDTILGVSGAYTVTGDNAGKTICVDVTYGNKTLTWTADDVVAAAVNPPEQPDKVADPQITPAGGSYTNSIDVTITCATDGASVYYTTDGSVPTTSSTLYTNKFTLTNSAAIKAIAVKDGMTDSSVVSVAYTINKGNNNSVGSYNPGDLGGGMIGNIAPATAPATTIPAAGITPTGNPVYDNGTTAVKEENVSSEAGSATETTAAADTNAAGKSDTNTETTSTTSVNTQTTTVAGGTTAVDTTPAPQETIETMTAVDNGTPLASGPASGGNPDAANGGKTNPVTGDNMVLLFALFTLAGIGAVVIIRKKLADK